MPERTTTAVDLRSVITPLTGAGSDYDPLLEAIGDARYVLIGEASHGTHEFYRERAAITRRLIEEKGFNAVAVEADWPDAYRVNRFVHGESDDADAEESLRGFERFPAWMWRNTVVRDFVTWLREWNDGRRNDVDKAGFYGLDLYSLFTSIEAVLRYLDEYDSEAAQRARYRYSCFDHYGEDSQAYGYAASFGMSPGCEKEVVEQLVDLQRRAGELRRRDGQVAADEYFVAEQNARLVRNAEEYYRTMFSGRVSSWNIRDRHMAETLHALVSHLEKRRSDTRVVVWEHNSHLGDARATDMGRSGEWNVGQLVRERYGRESRLIGLTTFRGTVTAATDWDGAAERKRVRDGMAGSYERLFHETGERDFMLDLRGRGGEAIPERLLERAIGVIYRPESERVSHYFHADLARQFDVVLHFDETTALEPLEPATGWRTGEAPETYPSGI